MKNPIPVLCYKVIRFLIKHKSYTCQLFVFVFKLLIKHKYICILGWVCAVWFIRERTTPLQIKEATPATEHPSSDIQRLPQPLPTRAAEPHVTDSPPAVRRTLTLLLHRRDNRYHIASLTTGKQCGQSDHTVRSPTSNRTQIELSITEVTLALAPNSSILNKPHPPPLILARQPVSRQPLLRLPRSMPTRPRPL
jgi:hypothetical protein